LIANSNHIEAMGYSKVMAMRKANKYANAQYARKNKIASNAQPH
jgi:hypothetical protein